jgi:hypothetical protein
MSRSTSAATILASGGSFGLRLPDSPLIPGEDSPADDGLSPVCEIKRFAPANGLAAFIAGRRDFTGSSPKAMNPAGGSIAAVSTRTIR